MQHATEEVELQTNQFNQKWQLYTAFVLAAIALARQDVYSTSIVL